MLLRNRVSFSYPDSEEIIWSEFKTHSPNKIIFLMVVVKLKIVEVEKKVILIYRTVQFFFKK